MRQHTFKYTQAYTTVDWINTVARTWVNSTEMPRFVNSFSDIYVRKFMHIHHCARAHLELQVTQQKFNSWWVFMECINWIDFAPVNTPFIFPLTCFTPWSINVMGHYIGQCPGQSPVRSKQLHATYRGRVYTWGTRSFVYETLKLLD